MQNNAQLQEKVRQISQLNGEVIALKTTSSAKQEEIGRLKAQLRELEASAEAAASMHQNEISAKNKIISRLQEDIERDSKSSFKPEDLKKAPVSTSGGSSKEAEAEYNKKLGAMREEYEATIRELRSKLLEYKERLKLEEQKNAQSNDFGFEDDDVGRVQIENETLSKQVKLLQTELQDLRKEKDDKDKESSKSKRGYEQSLKEVTDLKSQLNDLRSLYQKLELANDQLKKAGGGSSSTNERVAAATLKQFEELERKYIQTKK